MIKKRRGNYNLLSSVNTCNVLVQVLNLTQKKLKKKIWNHLLYLKSLKKDLCLQRSPQIDGPGYIVQVAVQVQKMKKRKGIF